MTDHELGVEGRDSEQDELDHLLSQGRPVSIDGNEYSSLYRHLGTYEAILPGNFSDQVMQRILRIKIERARADAIFQSALIGIVTLIAGVGLAIFSARYLGSQDLFHISAQAIQALILPGSAALVVLLLDGILVRYPLSAKH